MKQKTLLVVDVQNEFCHPNGFFARNKLTCNPEGFFGDGKLSVKSIDKVVDNIESVIAYFRKEGFPIIYVRGVGDPQFLSQSRFERYKQMYEQGFLKDGTWSTDFYRIKPLGEEPVFTKGGLDAFSDTQFREYVQRTASGLILAGFFTDVCIDAIAMRAEEKGIGIPTEIIADCTASLYWPQDKQLDKLKMLYGTKIHQSLSDHVLSSADVNKTMGGKMIQEFDKQRNFYSRLIEYISQGDVELEPEARQLVEKFDFSREDLESALKSGKNNAYRGLGAFSRVSLHIGMGDLELEQAARRLIKEYGIHPVDLDLALHVGRSSAKGSK